MSTMHTTANTKKRATKFLLFIVIIVLIGAFCFIKYKQSQLSYKLEKIGYKDAEITTIINSDEITKNYILNNEYNQTLVSIIDNSLYDSTKLETYLSFLNTNKTSIEATILLVNNSITTYKANLELIFKETYFIPKNLTRYVDYFLNNDTTSKDAVSIVNVNADHQGYEFDHDTDMSKGILILTNKYYKLKSDYKPNDLQELGSYSSWGSIRKEVYDAFVKMIKDAQKEGYTLRSVSPFRDYKIEERLNSDY